MKILEIKAMRGPNFWSIRRHKLILMKIDLEEMEERPTNLIDGFADNLLKLIPSLAEHRCSETEPGGFIKRVKQGTWAGHVIEHIALEIQSLAGMPCGFGRTRSTRDKGVYNVVFCYQEEEAGRYAAEAAVDIVDALSKNKPYKDLDYVIKTLQSIREEEGLGPSSECIVKEAEKRGIPYMRLNSGSRIMLGYGSRQKRIQASVASSTSVIGVDIAGDKDETKNVLRDAGIPVARSITVNSTKELHDAVERLGFPLVTKPLDGNHGRAVTININSVDQALEGFHSAQRVSQAVIVERFVKGTDFRFLVINYKVVAVAERTPAAITGDGASTIQQLIDQTNADPRRGNGHSNVLTLITIDETTEAILTEKGLTLNSVLPDKEVLFLKRTANLSTGGTATDVTDAVHPHNIFLAERIASVIGLDICGIDIMAPDITKPINENGGVVLEVNAGPGLRMHIAPTHGEPRNVGAPIIDMLFPEGTECRIPIVAVTGTNGKTTTTRLIAHIAKTAGQRVGYTTTDGIYIHGKLIEKGDCTGSISTRFVLKDPTVDFAVLECARGGLLKNGLGFDKCDVGIVTNIAEDHLGLQDIHNVEQMARVKSVIPEAVSPTGYAVLNADDDLVYNMHENVKSNIAYFSMDDCNPRILEHCQNGGLAAYVCENAIYIQKGINRKKVADLDQVPLTFKGKATFMVQNVLAAVIAAYVQKFKMEEIRLGLQTFIPSPKLTPGRLNIFEFPNFKVMVDYAHNPAGLEALSSFMDSLEEQHKVGIIAGIGDRRDEDIFNVGMLSAQLFDEIIIRLDEDLRGREAGALIEMVNKGISSVDPELPVHIIPDSIEATDYAIDNAQDGSFITICTEKVHEQIKHISQRLDEWKVKPEGIQIKRIKPKPFTILNRNETRNIQARA